MKVNNKSSGVYLIKNLVNGKIYVGSTGISQGFKRRWNNHKKELRGGYHKNSHLQFAWNKYSGFNFEFSVLEKCKDDILIEREQHWINYHKSYDRKFGYNLRGAGNRGNISEESKRKMGEARKKWSEAHPELVKKNIEKLSIINTGNKYSLGRWASVETKKKMSEIHSGENNGFYGKCHTKESKQKMKKYRLGKKHSEATKRKMSISRAGNKNCLGNILSKEHKKKISESCMGIKNNLGMRHTEETKKKISEAKKGKKMSEKTKDKISKANKGRKHTEETKRKISKTKRGNKKVTK